MALGSNRRKLLKIPAHKPPKASGQSCSFEKSLVKDRKKNANTSTKKKLRKTSANGTLFLAGSGRRYLPI
ncbi:MAG: hypothetical protein IKA16_05895 [Oscillospiraceae bacterium]|nr:hypothetical protein [Oscillospiraceae bacterium]